MNSPFNRSSKYISAEQGMVTYPVSGIQEPAITALNRLLGQYKALEKAALRGFLARGCGCCVNHDEQSEADADLGKAVKAMPYDDGSGYDIHGIAYVVLNRPDPYEEFLSK